MRVLCVGRHQFLSEHFCSFFRELGVDTMPAVGLEGALAAARRYEPDAVVCDYDLLATVPLDQWEQDPLLGQTPVIAVSLARRPGEAHLLDVNGIAGFLYLPALDRGDALRVLAAAERAGPLFATKRRGPAPVRAPQCELGSPSRGAESATRA